MLDVGWTEIVVIAVVMIIVVGPKDLPPMLRTFGKMMTKMRGMASDFRQQFDEALKEADLDDLRKTLSDAQKLNPAHSIREAMNPLRQMGNDIKADLQKATAPDQKTGADAKTTGDTKPAVDTETGDTTLPPPAELSAEVVVTQGQPKADVVAAAAIASAAKQVAASQSIPKSQSIPNPTAMAHVEAVKTRAKRIAKPKTVITNEVVAADVKTPAAKPSTKPAAKPSTKPAAKPSTKKVKAALDDVAQPVVRKAAVKTAKKKGDA